MNGLKATYLTALTAAILLSIATRSVLAQTINCSSGFNTTTTASGACGVSVNGGGADFWIANHPTTILNGTAAILAPADAGHQGNSLIRQVKVNNQAFTANFTFVPNGLDVSFILENQTNQSGQVMTGGAGGEGGFSQFAGGTNIAPNNVFALMFDQDGPLTNTSSFVFSNVQIYQPLQPPYIPLQDQPGYLPQYLTNKLSTAPVPLNFPASIPGTTTGDTYSATITYDGYNLNLSLYDVTAGGSCPGASCFTHTWTGVYIPEITGATSSYVGLVAGTSGAGGGAPYELDIKSFTYTVNTPTGTPTFTAWNANSTYNNGTPSAASPVYSLAPGTYPGAQTVSISTSTGPHNYICYVLSATPPTLYPQPDNNGGCNTGTLYTGPISIASTATLYAMAGSNNSAFPLGSINPPGLGPPSTLVAGTYTIGAQPTAAIPTFAPAGGTYTAAQTVTVASATPGAVICYNTTGNPATNGSTGCTTGTLFVSPITVSSSEKIYAVAGGAGTTDSPVASANYVINIPPPTPVATTTTLSAPLTQLINGQQATITATVTPASGAAATGSVSFYAGALLLGSATLNNGQATFIGAIAAQAGTYQVTATYNGSALDNKSTSAPLTFNVLATTTAILTTNIVQVVEGSPVVLLATVTPQFGSLLPTGAVTFYAGPTALGTQQLGAGKATDSAQINLPPGQYQLTAVYAGDADDETTTSNAVTLTVTAPVTPQVSTNTVLTITPTTALTAGQSMHLSALVTAASGSTPTGVVSFYLGQTQIGSANLQSGVAGVSVSAPASSGSYQITAIYAGTAQDNSSSSAPVTITIAPSIVATTTTLVSSAQQLTQGQPFVLSATVSASGSSNVAGTVSFYLGQTQLGSATLAGGQAIWTGTASFAAGTYQVTAVYGGNTQNSGSTSAPVSITVTVPVVVPTIYSTITNLSVNPQQITAGQSLTLNVQVAEQGGTAQPTGTVTFYLGQTQIQTVSLANGLATWTGPAAFAPGTYSVTAVYSGDAVNTASTSQPISLTVNAAVINPTIYSTATALNVNPQQVTAGQNLTLSVQVAEQGGTGTPTGAVSLFLGQTQIQTVALANGLATWTGSAAFAPGTYSVTAVYSGDTVDASSTSQPVSLTVNAVVVNPTTFSTTTGLTATPQTVITGQNVTLSVLVAEQGGSANPAGSVTFYLGQTPVGTAMLANGTASFGLQAPAPGGYTLTASYAGQGEDLASQSQPITLTVQPATSAVPPPLLNPSFTLGLSDNSVSMVLGKAQSASLQVLLSAVQGYQGAVQLSCSGLPAGVSCNFSPDTVALQASNAHSVLSLSSTTSTSAKLPMMTDITWSLLLPWDILGLFGLFSGKQKLKSRFGTMAFLIIAISGGMAAMTGCGLTVNNATTPYQVSVTALGANQQSQTQSFTLFVTAPAANF